jgi:hypothetical protein
MLCVYYRLPVRRILLARVRPLLVAIISDYIINTARRLVGISTGARLLPWSSRRLITVDRTQIIAAARSSIRLPTGCVPLFRHVLLVTYYVANITQVAPTLLILLLQITKTLSRSLLSLHMRLLPTSLGIARLIPGRISQRIKRIKGISLSLRRISGLLLIVVLHLVL